MRSAMMATVLCSFAFPASALDAPRVPAGTNYSAARGMMMRQGFEVVKVDPRDDGKVRCAPGREEVCTAYPETRYCSGTGLARCEFMFTRRNRGGGLYTVETKGEDVDPQVVRVRTVGDREISGFLAE